MHSFEAVTVPGLAEEAARRWPDGVAVMDGGRRIGFAELAARMRAAAAGFVAAGLEVGDRVAIWAPNSAGWVVACLGLQAAGGVLVPLNTRFRASEAEFILRSARCAFAVAAESFLKTSYADLVAGMNLPALRGIIRMGPDGELCFPATTSAHRAETARRLAALRGDDLSDIMFTSGTTGNPKGAMASHSQTVAVARAWGSATGLGPDDRFLVLWPFFHCSGYKAGWVACLAAGAATLPEAVLDPDRLLARVTRDRVTFLPGPPTLFQTLLERAGDAAAGLESVRVSVTGAAMVAPALIAAMRAQLGIPVVLTGYGLTETCGTVTLTVPDDPPEIVASSCGKAIPGIEIDIVDEDGVSLPRGATGDIRVRGQYVMQGYLDDLPATQAAIDAAGWLATGDVGVLDDNGYLRISDRKKDMFIVGGFNCYPAEIEKVLLSHPGVAQASVVGASDPRMGEVGHAFVVPRIGVALVGDELIGWCRERLANFKVPRFVTVMTGLPTNATGKVQKFRLLQMAGSPASSAQLRDEQKAEV